MEKQTLKWNFVRIDVIIVNIARMILNQIKSSCIVIITLNLITLNNYNKYCFICYLIKLCCNATADKASLKYQVTKTLCYFEL